MMSFFVGFLLFLFLFLNIWHATQYMNRRTHTHTHINQELITDKSVNIVVLNFNLIIEVCVKSEINIEFLRPR